MRPSRLHCERAIWIDEKQAARRPFGYNIAPTAGSPLGVKHTLETRAKAAAAMRGKKFGPEFCKAVSEALKGRKRAPFSEEWRRRLSESKKGKPKPNSFGQKVSELNRRRHAARRQKLGLGEKPKSSIGTTINCVICGKPFVKRTAYVKSCGIECRVKLTRIWELRKRKSYAMIACTICGSEFKPDRHNAVACSPECRAERSRLRKRRERTESGRRVRIDQFAFMEEPLI